MGADEAPLSPATLQLHTGTPIHRTFSGQSMMSMTSLGSGDGIEMFLVQPFAFAQCKEIGGPGSERDSLFAAANDVANDTAWTVDGRPQTHESLVGAFRYLIPSWR